MAVCAWPIGMKSVRTHLSFVRRLAKRERCQEKRPKNFVYLLRSKEPSNTDTSTNNITGRWENIAFDDLLNFFGAKFLWVCFGSSMSIWFPYVLCLCITSLEMDYTCRPCICFRCIWILMGSFSFAETLPKYEWMIFTEKSPKWEPIRISIYIFHFRFISK